MPFYTQDLRSENCFRCENMSTNNNPNNNHPKLENTNVDIANLPQDENQYVKQKFSSEDSIVQKHCLPRKREASNILQECVKRRDNLRNIDCYSNVPSFEPFNHDCNISVLSETLTNSKMGSLQKEDCEIRNDDFFSPSSLSFRVELLDTSSLTDSGVESLSKGSSPSHSIDNVSSKSDLDEESSVHFMNVDTVESSSSAEHKSKCDDSRQQSNGSSVAIYEDLNCLHLTDETSLSKDKSEILNSNKSSIMPIDETALPRDILEIVNSNKSPIMPSLFSSVSPTIYFCTKGETVGTMPEDVLPLMKWKLSTITPLLIRDTVRKSGFHLLDVDTTEDWIGTWGKHLKCATFKKVKNFQKVNHFPGSFHLGRKDKLWDNFRRMQNRHGIKAYNFFPETFLLPADLKSLKQAWENENEKCWIVKPPASARGTGVKVIYKWSQIPKNRPVVVQRYVSDPYLINGTKFDLRIYVLVPSIEPLRIYVFEDGLVRFASEKYSLSSKSFGNRFIHLTNYSINRKSSSYTANEDENSCQGHKWSLKSFWNYMSNSGIDVCKIKEAIEDMVIKTVICSEGPICRLMKTYTRSTYSCFELFGFDIMLDKDLRPWLLEVNISPSLHTRSLLDSNVKGQLVKDMFNIVGFQVPEKNLFHVSDHDQEYGIFSSVGNRHKALRNRLLSDEEKKKHSIYTFDYGNVKPDILCSLTPDDLRCLIESEDEFHRRGCFTRVFPSETSSKYFVYFEHIRYYNLLLDAWEKSFYENRNKGISHLQDFCDKKLHMQNYSTRMESSQPALTITAH